MFSCLDLLFLRLDFLLFWFWISCAEFWDLCFVFFGVFNFSFGSFGMYLDCFGFLFWLFNFIFGLFSFILGAGGPYPVVGQLKSDLSLLKKSDNRVLLKTSVKNCINRVSWKPFTCLCFSKDFLSFAPSQTHRAPSCRDFPVSKQLTNTLYLISTFFFVLQDTCWMVYPIQPFGSRFLPYTLT